MYVAIWSKRFKRSAALNEERTTQNSVVNTSSDLIANANPGVPNDWRAITALNRKYFSTTHYRRPDIY